jgi:Holliday junction DNA helicase RuvA
MISSLKGTIIQIDSKSIVLEVGDIGYKIFVTADTLHSLQLDSKQQLFTYLAIRENAMDLYGFTTPREKDIFELLISVSGIGPKGAINILSAVTAETLMNAIRTGSTTHLVKVSGIGRKTAEKIVLELKDKIGVLSGPESTITLSSDSDAIEALKMLGYNTDEARESLKKISKDITDTGEKIKAALKVLN